MFAGLPVTKYAFFSMARDGVGHTEASPLVADATTTTLPSYPPLIDPLPNFAIQVGELLTVTNFTHDIDTKLSFNFGPGAPAGATLTTIGPEKAVFRWQPVCLQGNTTNVITIWVTDNGTAPASNSVTFTVRVSECVKPGLGTLVLRDGQTGVVPFNLTATTNYAKLFLGLPLPTNRLTMSASEITNTAMICSNWFGATTNGYFIELSACSNRWIYTSNRVERQGWLYLTAATGQPSGFVPLEFAPIVGTLSSGGQTTTESLSVGRVIIVGEEPLLDAVPWTDHQILLTVYAKADTTNRLEFRSGLPAGGLWQFYRRVSPTNELHQTLAPITATNQSMLFRAVRE